MKIMSIFVLQKKEIKANVARYLPEITVVLSRVPREMLLVFKTNDLLRGIEASLGRIIFSFTLMKKKKIKLNDLFLLKSKFIKLFVLKFVLKVSCYQQSMHKESPPNAPPPTLFITEMHLNFGKQQYTTSQSTWGGVMFTLTELRKYFYLSAWFYFFLLSKYVV